MIKDQKTAQLQVISYASHPSLEECLSIIKKDAKRSVYHLAKSSDVIQSHQQAPKILFVYYLDHLTRLKDLLRVANYLKVNKPKSDYIIAVVGSVQHPKLHDVLYKLGCSDYIVLNQPARGLRMKLNRIAERLEVDKDALFGSHSGERTAKSGRVSRIGPIEIQYDYWIYPKWSVFKKVMGQWIFELRGPSPNVGRWLEADAMGEWGEGCYWWTPHELDYPLFKGQTGVWIFKSRSQPEYKDPHWTFVGQEPQFVYYDPIQKYPRYKVKTTNEGNLEVAANSKASDDLISLINKSYEFELRIKTTHPGGFLPDGIRSLSNSSDAAIPMTTLSDKEVQEIDHFMERMKNTEALDTFEDDNNRGFFNTDSNPTPTFSFDTEKSPDTGLDLTFSKDIFKKVEDKALRESFLVESEKKFKTSVIWTQGRKYLISVKSTNFDPKNRKVSITLHPSPEFPELVDHINEQTLPAVYFNVTLPRSAIFLNMPTKDLKVKGHTMEYSFKEEMWQVQRRAHFRYEFLAHDKTNAIKLVSPSATITLGGKRLLYALADISAGGARVLVPPQELTLWTKGTIVELVELSMGGKAIKTKAVVKWSKKLNTPYSPGHYQAGIEFVTLQKPDQKWINDQILAELNDYFKQFPLAQ